MNQTTARQLVLVSMLVTGSVVGYDLVRGNVKGRAGAGDSFRAVWSLAVLFLLMAILADTVPGIAGPFAGIVALAVLIGRSDAVNQLTNTIPTPKGAK